MKTAFKLLLCLVFAVPGCVLPDVPESKPVPPAVVTVESLWIVTIDDAMNRTVATASVLADLDYRAKVTGKGHKWNVVDAGNADAKKYAEQVKETGLPCVLILDAKSHKLLKAAPLPKDQAAMDALLKTYSGK